MVYCNSCKNKKFLEKVKEQVEPEREEQQRNSSFVEERSSRRFPLCLYALSLCVCVGCRAATSDECDE